MTEAYLQNIWANKRIPAAKLCLSDGRQLTINDVGVHNTQLSGPDFFMGVITLEDVALHGSIEIHVNASDWRRHGHDQDENYNNVILHVVYNHDEEVVQNGCSIPTLELKEHIDWEHFDKYIENKIKCQDFPCENLLESIDPIYLESMKSKALHQKLAVKTELVRDTNLGDYYSVFYHLLGSAFGTSINKVPFEHLLRKVPFESLGSLTESQRYQLLVSESGIIQAKSGRREYEEQWHFKGTRPKNFPTVRVKQFAFLASRFDFKSVVQLLEVSDLKESFRSTIQEIWRTRKSVQRLSKGFENHLLINAVVPFLWYYGECSEDDLFKEKAIQLLGEIPGENNSVLRKWKKIGVDIKNAFDSQAFLALHRYYCCHKKCLSCEVGNKILNRSK